MVAAVMAEPAHRPPPPLFRSIVLDPMRAFAGLEAAGVEIGAHSHTHRQISPRS